MRNKEKRSLDVRFLNSFCALALLVCIAYIVFAGFQAVIIGVALLALGGVAVPVAMEGEGLVEIILGIFEAVIEGIIVIFEAIANFFYGLFG